MGTREASKMITVTEAAQVLGISVRAVYGLASSAQIACYRFGRSVRFEVADVAAYKAACRQPVQTDRRTLVPLHTSKLQVSDPIGESSLLRYFRSRGLDPFSPRGAGLRKKT